jgi:putative ABC transport system permease protein
VTAIRAAFRRLRHRPGFAVGATLSLAIGMSLGTAVFSLVNSVMTRPLPYGDVERLGEMMELLPNGFHNCCSSAKLILELRANATSLSHVAATSYRSVSFIDGEQRAPISGAAVTPNYFETAQPRPVLGRLFATGDTPDQRSVVVSYEFWKSKLGGDTTIIGRPIILEARETGSQDEWRVLGVLPPRFGVYQSAPVWFLLDEDALAREAAEPRNNDPSYGVWVRRKADVSAEAANVQVATLFKRLYRGQPAGSRSAEIVSIRTLVVGGVIGSLNLWSAAAILILILCAVNFATMSLARGLRRRGEIAVRAALGASRWNIVSEIVTEAMVLSAVSGALSVLVAWWLMSFAAQLLGGWLPVEPSIDWRVMMFGVIAAMLVGFVFAVAPAVELAKVDLRSVLQGHSSAVTSKGREAAGQRLLVALQLSLAVTAVATITAVMQADRRLYGKEAGFDYDQIVFADVSQRDTLSRIVGEPVRERIAAMPGVVRVASTWWLQNALVWDNAGEVVDIPRMYLRYASPNLFDVIGTGLVAGRLPSEDEARDATGVVASALLARKVFGDEQTAVGKRVKIKLRGRLRDWTTIVGVAPDVTGLPYWGVSSTIYILQRPDPRRYSQYIIAVSGDVKARAREIQTALRGMDSRLSVSAQAATTQMQAAVGATRGRYLFLMGVAGLALVLAIVGVYGMTSYTTEIRLRDYGIRLALGANAPRLLQVMFADVWWMAPLGVGVGVLAAGRLTAYLDALYRNPMLKGPLVVLHVGPTVAAALSLIAIAVLGTSLPLRRILKLDVMRTVQGSG